jgi:hypothetical protein
VSPPAATATSASRTRAPTRRFHSLGQQIARSSIVESGVRYLRILLDLTGDIDQAVGAYYQGYAALNLGVLYEDTIRYVADINASRDWFWPFGGSRAAVSSRHGCRHQITTPEMAIALCGDTSTSDENL